MNLLNDSFVSGQPKIESLREAFGKALTEKASKCKKIVALSADLATSVGLGDFRKTMAERYIEVGIAEQNLVTVASGLASMGKIPVAASYAAFSPGRNWEQIKTTICLNDQYVVILGTHYGLNVGADGATHQMLEDIALMSVLPNMTIYSPADAEESRALAFNIDKLASNGAVYIRLPRASLPTLYKPYKELVQYLGPNYVASGRGYKLRADDKPKLTIISTGSMTANSLLASGQLFKKGFASEVIHLPSIKPLDVDLITESARKTGRVVVVEEHQLIGGLGSLVASELLRSGVKIDRFQTIGIDNCFGQSGNIYELWAAYGLDVDNLVSKMVKIIE